MVWYSPAGAASLCFVLHLSTRISTRLGQFREAGEMIGVQHQLPQLCGGRQRLEAGNRVRAEIQRAKVSCSGELGRHGRQPAVAQCQGRGAAQVLALQGGGDGGGNLDTTLRCCGGGVGGII